VEFLFEEYVDDIQGIEAQVSEVKTRSGKVIECSLVVSFDNLTSILLYPDKDNPRYRPVVRGSILNCSKSHLVKIRLQREDL